MMDSYPLFLSANFQCKPNGKNDGKANNEYIHSSSILNIYFKKAHFHLFLHEFLHFQSYAEKGSVVQQLQQIDVADCSVFSHKSKKDKKR